MIYVKFQFLINLFFKTEQKNIQSIRKIKIKLLINNKIY